MIARLAEYHGLTMAQFDSVKAYIIVHGPQWLGALIILIVGVLASKLMELTLKVREDDVEIAITTIGAALADDARILKAPTPKVRVTSIAENGATLCIWAWTNPEDFESATADEYVRLFNRLREAEVQIV